MQLALLGPAAWIGKRKRNSTTAATPQPPRQHKGDAVAKPSPSAISYEEVTAEDGDVVLFDVNDSGPVTIVVRGYNDGVGARAEYLNIPSASPPGCVLSCFVADVTATPAEAPVNSVITLDIQLFDDCKRKGGSNGTTPAQRIGDNPATKSRFPQDVLLGVIGPAMVVESEGPAGVLATSYNVRTVAIGEDGSATVPYTVNGAGPITFVVMAYLGPDTLTRQLDYATVNAQCDTPPTPGGDGIPVSKVNLLFTKLHRAVNEPVTVTALAWDDNNAPVAGANVTFFVYGDCLPTLSNTIATTNTAGHASITVVGNQAGVCMVVAAGVNAAGAAVVSPPAQLIFFSKPYYGGGPEHNSYGDSSEEYHYGGGHGVRERYRWAVVCFVLFNDRGVSA